MNKTKSAPVDKVLYNKVRDLVKSRVKVWPSAYASGQVVSEYKRAFAGLYGKDINPYDVPLSQGDNPPLDRWFREEWVNVCEKDTNGNYRACGRPSAELRSSIIPIVDLFIGLQRIHQRPLVSSLGRN